jgi:hypothetical protein
VLVTVSRRIIKRHHGNVAQQLKVTARGLQIEASVTGMLDFGSLGHVFAATDGNVHFDRHLSFVTVDGRFVLVCYQVKRRKWWNGSRRHVLS